MTVLQFPGHHWKHCTDRECRGCHLCHGGLAVCTICHGMEGGLPTDCPGRKMTGLEHGTVYEGRLDYQRGRGWVEEPSRNSPAYHRPRNR